MDVAAKLQEAISSGETIEITYHGGSRPGSKRVVQPLAIEGDKLRARSEGERIAKAFKLSLIEIDGYEFTLPLEKNSGLKPAAEDRPLDELLSEHLESLRGFGWHVVHGPDFVHLYGTTKLGKPRKNPAVTLNFEPFILETQYDIQIADFRETRRETSQPWIARSPGYGARTSKLSKAFANLMKKAESTQVTAEPSR